MPGWPTLPGLVRGFWPSARTGRVASHLRGLVGVVLTAQAAFLGPWLPYPGVPPLLVFFGRPWASLGLPGPPSPPEPSLFADPGRSLARSRTGAPVAPPRLSAPRSPPKGGGAVHRSGIGRRACTVPYLMELCGLGTH